MRCAFCRRSAERVPTDTRLSRIYQAVSRLRKIYEITDKGRSQIDDFIDDWHEIEAVYEYIKEGKGRE